MDPGHSEVEMDDESTSSWASYANSWISWFVSRKGHEYFCEVDDDYILDRFNLTGLNTEVPNYGSALRLITDCLEGHLSYQEEERIEAAARSLYALIHARFIITQKGMDKMIEKYKARDFGTCPRVLCGGQALLPVGLTDQPYQKPVKLYCMRCEDIYTPKSTRHASIDGAAFGTTFPHMLLMVNPWLLVGRGLHVLDPENESTEGSSMTESDGSDIDETESSLAASEAEPESLVPAAQAGAERFVSRIFGFRVHGVAQLHRYQDGIKDRQQRFLKELGLV